MVPVVTLKNGNEVPVLLSISIRIGKRLKLGQFFFTELCRRTKQQPAGFAVFYLFVNLQRERSAVTMTLESTPRH
jgi:hypothetical protein